MMRVAGSLSVGCLHTSALTFSAPLLLSLALTLLPLPLTRTTTIRAASFTPYLCRSSPPPPTNAALRPKSTMQPETAYLTCLYGSSSIFIAMRCLSSSDAPHPHTPAAASHPALCPQITIQPEADYLTQLYGSNSICIAQTGCTSPTAKPLSPGGSLLFEPCTPPGMHPTLPHTL